jgi:transposase
MAMGKKRSRQGSIWIANHDLARSPGHPFYERLNRLLEHHGFDVFVEEQCRSFYADRLGRPSVPPGMYFRLLLIGYFEGIDSERGIAWRIADSLTLREFLGLALSEAPPDHSTISRNRRLIDVETHQEVFAWVLSVLGQEGLLRGQTIGIDATTLEANAAMKSIVRRDTGEGYREFLERLAQESGELTPTRAELARKDKKRKGKGSNDDWTNPHDPDAKITKMKDGRTHLAHKSEHAVDLETGAIVAVTIQPADRGDTQSFEQTLSETLENLAVVAEHVELPEQVLRDLVADRGYHSGAVLKRVQELGLRTYIAEPKRPRRKWRRRIAEQKATYANRRRMKGARGKKFSRWRCEKVERSMAHSYETGGLRRIHLRGHSNILKRVLIHEAGFNLSLVMRQRFGHGTPRGLQGRLRRLLSLLFSRLRARCSAFLTLALRKGPAAFALGLDSLSSQPTVLHRQKLAFATGC